jgi:hypothetical protein
VRGCLHLQLGGTFWRAWDYHHRQRNTVHFCPVVFYMHEPRHQARAHHCLPPTEQRHGGARAQAAQGCPTCTWGGPGVALPSPVGVAGPTCCPQGGFCSIFSGAGHWDTTGSSWTAPARARSSTCRRVAASHEAAAAANSPPAHLARAEHVYVRVGGQQRPWAAPYAGPYLVVSKGAKTFTIQVGQRKEVVSVDRLKPHTGPGPITPAEAASCGRPPKMPAAPSIQPASS